MTDAIESSDTAAKLSSILTSRHARAKHIAAIERQLIDLQAALERLQDLLPPPDAEDQTTVAAPLEHVHKEIEKLFLSDAVAGLPSRLSKLEQLHQRFSRETINIGTIGEPRQGKSELLQKISGLTSEVIPSSDKSHCTAARSFILHKPDTKPNARIVFYSPAEFLDQIIRPFFEWEGGKFGMRPPSDIRSLSGPPPRTPPGLDATDTGVFNELLQYWKYFPLYKQLLGTEKQVNLEDLHNYVTHKNAKEEELWHWRAVARAEVSCQFPFRDVGKIALTDLPGYGSHNVSDEALILRSLQNNVDFMLYVFLPPRTGGALTIPNTKIYALAGVAFDKGFTALWSSGVINHWRSSNAKDDNLPQCQVIQKELATSSIKTWRNVIVDCSSPDEVRSLLVDPVLTYLSENLERIDDVFSGLALSPLARDLSIMRGLLMKAITAIKASNEVVIADSIFETVFSQVWDELNFGLTELLDRHRGSLSQHSDEFLDACQEILDQLDLDGPHSPLPSLERTLRTIARSDSSFRSAFEQHQTMLRAGLGKAFSELDPTFKRLLETTKYEITTVLQEHGLIYYVDSEDEEEPGTAFLTQFCDALREAGLPDSDPLAAATQVLIDCRLSYRGFLQHRIRKNLDRLVPNNNDIFLHSGLASVDAVLETLRKLYTQTLNEIALELNKIAVEPRLIMFALIEEFNDRVLRTEGVRMSWRAFYRQNAQAIWPEDFGFLQQQGELHGVLLRELETAHICVENILASISGSTSI